MALTVGIGVWVVEFSVRRGEYGDSSVNIVPMLSAVRVVSGVVVDVGIEEH